MAILNTADFSVGGTSRTLNYFLLNGINYNYTWITLVIYKKYLTLIQKALTFGFSHNKQSLK